jgi:hypothetical protein
MSLQKGFIRCVRLVENDVGDKGEVRNCSRTPHQESDPKCGSYELIEINAALMLFACFLISFPQ